jgi:two-component system response regulator CpxR
LDAAVTPTVRVLFVDDDDATRSGYSQYLAAQGFNVVPASNGNDALTAAQTLTLDVIVLDLGLPDIDGWEVARQLKGRPATAHVPIIALSGSDLPHERVSAMRAGCDRHLAKPCSPADLVAAIQRAVDEGNRARL